MTNYSNNPFGSVTTSEYLSNNPFGSVTLNMNKIDISADLEIINRNKNKDAVMDVLSSAVGDFAERPLQIMIREIAKNFLIFTPVGWIILLFIIGRRYKSNISSAATNAAGKLNNVFDSAITTLGVQLPKKEV
ncbi:hypothetical protein J6P92_01755 [bacterium]|nr:hypothetical protein [bacterium]